MDASTANPAPALGARFARLRRGLGLEIHSRGIAVKLLKRDRTTLEGIRSDLQRAVAFINSDDTAIMRRSGMQSADVFRSNMHPEGYNCVCKEIGSELVRLFVALDRLNSELS